MKIGFSINLYDEDGDQFDECILLFVGKDTIIRFSNQVELKDFAREILNNIIPEIEENVGYNVPPINDYEEE